MTEWLKEIRMSHELNVKERAAVNAIQQIGTNAIPFLLRLLKAHDSQLKLKANALLREQKLVRFRFRTSDFQRYLAIQGFWALGAMAATALPELEVQFYSLAGRGKNAELQGLGRALTAVGPAAFPTLERALTNQNPEARIAVILGFRESTNYLPDAAPILTKSIETEPLGGLKIWTAIMLAKTGQYRELVVPQLLSGMKFAENDTRAESVKSLLNYPGAAEEHIVEIRKLAEDRDTIARNGARHVLRIIDPESAEKIGN